MVIKFETAKLVKEKGFNEPVFYYYSSDGSLNKLIEESNGEREYYFEYEDFLESYNDFNLKVQVYSACTQSALQKWLREKHNIHILMNAGMHNGKEQTFYCNVVLFGKNLYKSKFKSKTSMYSYEEALEKGLIEALKLIEYEVRMG